VTGACSALLLALLYLVDNIVLVLVLAVETIVVALVPVVDGRRLLGDCHAAVAFVYS
jgi:hypothetical protein